MRLFLAGCFLCSCLTLQAQQAEEMGIGPSGRVLLKGGPLPQSIVLLLPATAPGDSITVNVPTKEARIALVTPRGQRITAANAESLGFDWLRYAQKLPLGSEDGGATVEITFRQTAPAGRFRIELRSTPLRTPLNADARFTSRMEEYTRTIRSAAGAQMSEAVALDRAAVARLKLGPTDRPAFLDIAVPDATVDVTVTLPGGRVLSPRQPPARAGEWKKVEVLHGKSRNEADSLLLAMGAMMPIDGTHYVVGLEKVEPGLYEVHATPGKAGAGELRVAFLPLASIAAEHTRQEEARERPAAGTVKIRARPLPFECSAGDRLELVVSLSGDAGSESPNFEVGIERRAKLRDTEIGIQYANPGPVQWRPAEMTRTADGSYHGRVTVPDPGMVRIAVRATGRTAAGKPFADEAIVTNEFMIVKPVVAHFRSLRERAVGQQGSSQFDRLEVSAELEVIEPGEYRMSFTLRDPGGASLLGSGTSGSAKLLAGVRELTVAVPGRKLWSDLRDGPFEITNLRIFRTIPLASSSSWVEVPTGGASLHTAAYTRNQWNPGAFYGEDRVSVHGIRPTASGRFRFAEVEWDVTTPGGACSWDGRLGENIAAAGGPIPIQSDSRRDLPRGRTKISFLFDGSLIAALAKPNPPFGAVVHCDSDPTKEGVRPPAQTLALNPAEYEPAHAGFFVHARNPLRLSPGSSGSTSVMVPNKTASQVRFALKTVPPELEGSLVSEVRPPQATAWVSLQVRAKPGAAPGRYYIAVDATCQGETETAEVVVDVIAGRRP